MTRAGQHPDIRSVSLRLHISGRGITWAVVYRTARGADVFDRRVSSGYLATARPLVGPATVVEALEAATAALRERHGLPPASGGPGAPGGGGGRPTDALAGTADTVPMSIVRDRA